MSDQENGNYDTPDDSAGKGKRKRESNSKDTPAPSAVGSSPLLLQCLSFCLLSPLFIGLV